MKGFLTSTGCEAESNDGSIKYILRKTTKFPSSGMAQTVYNAVTFVRIEGNSWLEAVGSGSSFVTIEEFIRSISKVPEMSQSYRDLIENY